MAHIHMVVYNLHSPRAVALLLSPTEPNSTPPPAASIHRQRILVSSNPDSTVTSTRGPPFSTLSSSTSVFFLPHRQQDRRSMARPPRSRARRVRRGDRSAVRPSSPTLSSSYLRRMLSSRRRRSSDSRPHRVSLGAFQMEPTAPQRRPWSDVPVDPLGVVLRFLGSHVDRIRFAAVCTQWRAAKEQQLSLPRPLPVLLLPDSTLYSLPRSEPFFIPDCAGYASACGKWLVFATDDSGCFLMDPFSKATLPLPASVRLLDFVSYWPWQTLKPRHMIELSLQVVCSQHLVAAIFCYYDLRNHIVLCRPGGSSWLVRNQEPYKWWVTHLAFHKGKLYTLTRDEDLLAVNIAMDDSTGDPSVSHLEHVIRGNHVCLSTFTMSQDGGTVRMKTAYLVESCDDDTLLLMVRRTLVCRCRVTSYPSKGVSVEQNEFRVFQADFGQSRWVETTTLGADQVLFLGQCCSGAVCVSQYGIPGDHIFFLENDDDDHSYWYDKESSVSWSAYNMKDGTVSSPPSPIVSWKHGLGFARWLFPWD